jgi:hypothetical protein
LGKEVKYFNVKEDAKQLEVMLEYSNGKRRVPVIVEGGKVTIGLNGRG